MNDEISARADMFALLAAAAVIALAGGLVPALVWAGRDATVPVLLTVVALAVSFLGFRTAWRSRRTARSASEAARRVAEADRMRAALLAAMCIGTVGFQREKRVVERGRFDIADDDLHPLGREPLGECETDAARASGDHRNSTSKFAHEGRIFQ